MPHDIVHIIQHKQAVGIYRPNIRNNLHHCNTLQFQNKKLRKILQIQNLN